MGRHREGVSSRLKRAFWKPLQITKRLPKKSLCSLCHPNLPLLLPGFHRNCWLIAANGIENACQKLIWNVPDPPTVAHIHILWGNLGPKTQLKLIWPGAPSCLWPSRDYYWGSRGLVPCAQTHPRKGQVEWAREKTFSQMVNSYPEKKWTRNGGWELQ